MAIFNSYSMLVYQRVSLIHRAISCICDVTINHLLPGDFCAKEKNLLSMLLRGTKSEGIIVVMII
jgi:hypothetical protein